MPEGAVFRGLQACGNVIYLQLQLLCNISQNKGLVCFLLIDTKRFSRAGGAFRITISPQV